MIHSAMSTSRKDPERRKLLEDFTTEIERLTKLHMVLSPDSEQIFAQKKKISAMKTRYAINTKRELVPEIWYLYRRYFE